ncbi:MAG TPA: calcium-binding EGF-like domain-containing protein [Candidatus Polarisedimenticolia bacterium]|nr:calcium-binding EGF-like domain-containing protein [Candidatus Polarisedimenticolia bacterium]
MKRRLLVALILGLTAAIGSSGAAVVYSQPPSAGGGFYHSSWWDPDGSDYDQYVWDGFVLGSDQGIDRIEWRGAYDPAYFGSGGPVVDFTVSIYASIAGGYQPDVIHPPLVQYSAGGSAGESFAGTVGNAAMYDYAFDLPTPFHAVAGVKYWVQIEASQYGIPDWSIAAGTGGDGQYFRRIASVGDITYQLVPGDAAFNLVAPDATCVGVADCSGHGVCIATDTCLCDPNWTGPDCGTPYAAPAGTVPDGTNGPPLTVDLASGGGVTLTWDPSCLATDTDYAVYEGVLGDFTSHQPRFCGTGGATTLSFLPQSDIAYFLVVPLNWVREGSYGLMSGNLERPPSAAACLPQLIAACN